MYEVINKRFNDVFKQPQKKKLFVGGGGSGKSISIAQHMCLGLISGDGRRRLVLRKYFPALRMSTLNVIIDILNGWKVPFKHQKTEHYIQVGNNYIFYASLDDSEKMKGSEFKEIWMEEATDFTEDDYKQLTIRLARDKNSEDTTLILSFNPIDQNNWCVKLLDEAARFPKEYCVHHSTYKDNIKNLSRSFVNELKSYKEKDENFYRIYALGLPGKLEGQIFTNFIIDDVKTWPWNKLNDGLHCYGLDFGFNHPMVLCEVFYSDGEFYARELFYRSECTTDDLAQWMQYNKVDHKCDIFADSAEPDRILSLNTTKVITSKVTGREITTTVNRFNVKEAKKDVRAGLDYMKSQKIHIDASSENLIKEIKGYRYRKDKDGKFLDEPIKIKDDGVDSLRYCIYSMKVNYLNPIPDDFSKGYSFGSSLSVKQFRL